ncbi:alpha/beta-Hydrolases superfamily protein [Actinidia rufa]|uniref:Alpha/beta-Hydrolases superfamily protein n=1 Tax=Actinidia rufa TaxID=165716 RepID=A0A7J0FCH6_9ERIC|nr:alpha/beta-Hydrolases superfamily protein [Actinidia rufa]
MVMVGKGLSLSIAMNARTIGAGIETVVLAHGFGADQSVWDKIVPSLTQRCRVVLFDWAFSGSVKDPTLFDPVKYSTFDAFADDLISLLDEMNLKSVFFVGHSMSGMIGCVASTKRPELFNRLILVGASPRYINLEDYEGGFEITEVDQLLSSIESNFHQWASSFASLVVGPNDPISVDKDTLEKVVIPCTIIQTINDVAVPVSVGDYMMKRIKAKSTVEIIEVDGHFPQLTADVQFLEVLGGVLPFDL